MRLEDLTKGATVNGVLPNQLITVVEAKWYGSEVIELIYKEANGNIDSELIYRDREHELEIVTSSLPWSFNGDGRLLRLVSEAQRIQLAHLFDPMLAVHTSLVEPLPHQITAVYGDMLPRQPLRFLLLLGEGLGERSETTIRNAGYAPYLDYRPLKDDEQTIIETFIQESNLPTDIEAEATKYAISAEIEGSCNEVQPVAETSFLYAF